MRGDGLLLICSPIQAQGDECVWVCVGSAEEWQRNIRRRRKERREREENAGVQGNRK